MSQGDRLFLYTDGIIEAAGPNHHIGMAGLEDVLKSTTNLDLDDQTAMVLEILKDVCCRAQQPASDDMTLVGLEVVSGSTSQVRQLETATVPSPAESREGADSPFKHAAII